MTSSRIISAIVAFITLSSNTYAASFQGLGDINGGAFASAALGISADGSTIMGWSASASGNEAFRWTSKETGLVGLGAATTGFEYRSSPGGISADGTVIVGWTRAGQISEPGGGYRAVKWTLNGGMEDLGFYGHAFDVSADGSVIVGSIHHNGYAEGYRLHNGVRQDLGYFAVPPNSTGNTHGGHILAVSNDGNILAGTAPFTWENGTRTMINDINGANGYGEPGDISTDGSIVVGWFAMDYGIEAFRTMNGTTIGLGDLPGGNFDSRANAVSHDGSTIVGASLTASGWKAFVWTESQGMIDLQDYLVNTLGVGNLTGWMLTHAEGISADGSRIVGYGVNPDGNTEGWLVDLSSFQALGDLPGGNTSSAATAISADGKTIIGGSNMSSGEEAFRWTAALGIEGLGDLPGGEFRSSPGGVSADGSVIVGWSRADSLSAPGGGFRAFKWTEASGMVDLGFYGHAFDVSANGSVIVGSIHHNGYAEGYRYENGARLDLGYFPVPPNPTDNTHGGHIFAVSDNGSILAGTGPFTWENNTRTMINNFDGVLGYGEPADMSSDGSVVVGWFVTSQGYEAFRYENNVLLGLGDLPGGNFDSRASAVTGDGGTIVGASHTSTGWKAFIWSQSQGTRDLQNYLENTLHIYNLAGWTLTHAEGISADGKIIVGYGKDPNGNTSAWLVNLNDSNEKPVSNAGADQPAIHIGTTVDLNGGGSTDPDEDFPLTFSWEIISAPTGSTAMLSDTTVVSPRFTPDMVGDYVIQLIVTDSKGKSSEPDTVTISFTNTAPVAFAGEDQPVETRNTPVQLSGHQSFDNDGDEISYQWLFLSKPASSTATLSDSTVVDPLFIADIQGQYIVQLVVTDEFGAVSEPDSVEINFDNTKPLANAGGNKSAVVGDTVVLTGSGTDANNDPLTYKWNIVALPAGRAATLDVTNTPQTSFLPDEAGIYTLQLTVNDGIIDSDPSESMVNVISAQSAVTQELTDGINYVNDIVNPASVLKNKTLANALTNKINAVISLIDSGDYATARDKLENDILNKTDGCANSVDTQNPEPDKNDWITDCAVQADVYAFVLSAIDYLDRL